MRLFIVALLFAISYAQTDFPDIVLIGDSLLDNENNNYGKSANPDMEQALQDAGFTVANFARFGSTIKQLDEIKYPLFEEYAEEKGNNIITIFSGGGNDMAHFMDDISLLYKVPLAVDDLGDKLASHSALVINVLPPWLVPALSDRFLAYHDGIQLKYSDYCDPGVDGVHPDNECIQQMHQTIIDILRSYQCERSGVTTNCECKDGFIGERCDEPCWAKDTWCWNCENCCNPAQQYWSGRYCSAEQEVGFIQNNMSVLNGRHFVGVLAIFGLISILHWLVQYFRTPKDFVPIQDAEADI